MDMDLRSMSLSELKALAKKVEKAIDRHESRRVNDARKEMEKVAKSFGVSLNEVMGADAVAKPGRKKKPGPKPKPKTKAKPKYKNPDDASQTWTGRGRQPAWYKAAVEAGKSEKDLAV